MLLGNIGAVFLFEWRRSLAPPRLALWALLVLFPPAIIGAVQGALHYHQVGAPEKAFWAVMLFALVPMLISMLGTFLWTSTAVSSELERQSWVYLATRHYGTTALLLGKYLAAVTWILPTAIIGLTFAVVLTQSEMWAQLWFSLVRLAILSCPAYAALYLALGTIFPRRAMVLSVAYTLIFELMISFVPAIINQFTVQYRLRALLVEWVDITLQTDEELAFLRESLLGDAPASFHVVALLGYTVVLVVLALVLIHTREFLASDEAEV